MERRLLTVTSPPPVCRSVGFTHTRRSERPVPQREVPDADPQNLTASPSKSAPIVRDLEYGARASSICVPFRAESLGGSFVSVGLRVRVACTELPLSSQKGRLLFPLLFLETRRN